MSDEKTPKETPAAKALTVRADELSDPAKCEACGVPLPFEREEGREWLCPRCFSALTPDERRRGVVKAAPAPPQLPKRKDSKR